MSKAKSRTERQLAAWAGVSPALAHRKRAAGMTDQDIFEQAKLRHKLQAARSVGRQRGTGESYAAAQARKETALASLRELELKQKTGELVEVAEVRRAWSWMISNARNRLLAAGTKLAPYLAIETAEPILKALVDDEIREILTDLSRDELPEAPGEASKA